MLPQQTKESPAGTMCTPPPKANKVNIGRKASILIYEKLTMIPGKYSLDGCRKINVKRLYKSKYENLQATKKHKYIRRGNAKFKDDKNNDKKDNMKTQGHSKT